MPDLDDVPGADAAINVRYATRCVFMRNDSGTGCFDDALVAADVVAVFVGIQDLCDRPAALRGDREALLVIQRINRKRVARLRARNQIIEIPVGVSSPDLLNNQGVAPDSKAS